MDTQGPRTRAEKFLSKEWQTRQDGRNLANDVIGLIDYIGKIQQEQAEWEKGCEYCNDEKSFEIHFDGEKAGIAYLHKCSDGWGLFLQMDDGDTFCTDVVNCPMCGKRLK